MKSSLRKKESYVTDNINRELDQPKSTIENIAVNVGNPNATGLGEDVNQKMGDVAVDKGGDEKSEKSYRDTIKQEKRVNFRFIENSSSADGVDVMLSKESVKKRFVKQKAKVKWLAEGDANTKYFHNILKCKNNKKTILSVLGVDAFLLPVFTSKEMEAKLRKFLWGIKDDNKATAKVSWKKMEGGTGADAAQYFFSLECD
ncbi:hypothetical protein QVD17_39576 [Tagetes erecta]|uniref:Uncharacterized protein n=1 Tax=Tagetes erecta TaxID=13708 RepID=A0AAD8JQA9_TARER|nr:hypothetical protein QVD17_39576 [Tagetes erecta]